MRYIGDSFVTLVMLAVLWGDWLDARNTADDWRGAVAEAILGVYIGYTLADMWLR